MVDLVQAVDSAQASSNSKKNIYELQIKVTKGKPINLQTMFNGLMSLFPYPTGHSVALGGGCTF